MSPLDFLELLLELLFDLIYPVVLAFVTELVRERRGGLDPEAGAANQVATGTLCVIAGGVAGFISALLFPHPIVHRRVIPRGASFVLMPLATGLAMHWFGVWRKERGSYPSLLATFWGGALFGLSTAMARFLVIQWRM
jgi:hypothetical protein